MAPPEKLTGAQVSEMAGLDDWRVLLGSLHCSFRTGSMARGIELATAIGAAADAADHHPDLVLTYPRLHVTLTTHDAGGLTIRDVEAARTISALAADLGVAAEPAVVTQPDGRRHRRYGEPDGRPGPLEGEDDLEDVLGYAGKHALVTGAASGMGAATVELLVALGARVTALDVKPVEVAGTTSIEVDLRAKASIDEALTQVDGPVDCIFSVAGLPGPPFSDMDTLLVNFIGARHLIEALLPTMPAGSAVACVASNAGLGWQLEYESLLPLVSSEGFDAAVAWVEANPGPLAANTGYLYSKKVTNAWVAWRAPQLVASRGIRLNNTNPGPTDTAMMPAFEALAGKELIDAFIGPSARRSTAEEQAWPLLFLNSPRSSYIAGEALHTDAGYLAAQTTGQL